MRTVVVVQARLGSTRLPGKVLMPLGGRSMLEHVVGRAARIEGIAEVAAAIPDLPEDDPLADAVRALGVRLVRGPADDVLARYLLAVEAIGADAVVRITADCPLLSPAVSSAVLGAFVADDVDYASNTLQRTWPRGLDTEVVSAGTLATAGAEAVDPAEREHVTPFVWQRPDRFRLRSVTTSPDRSALRLTVDTAEDLELLRRIVDRLGDAAELPEVLALLDREPELVALNADVPQKPVR